MPLSRPTLARHAAVSPPPSPEPHKTHTRKKSATPRAVKPTLHRRSTQHTERRSRSAHGDADEDRSVAADESFWNFCTYCDKQMDGHGSGGFLYCSETCRHHDLSPPHHHPATPPLSPHAFHTHLSPLDALDGGPDIIPRASPTLAIPLLHTYDPFFQPSASHAHSSTSAAQSHIPTTALASLRSLSSGLAARRASHDSSHSDHSDHHHLAAEPSWGYNPFAAPAPASLAPPSPRPQYASSVRGGSWAAERPLPPRGAGFGYRPRSVDLITPVGGF